MLHDGPDRKALVKISTELNLQKIIKKPTRITDTTQSLIDVILVSNTASVLESGVLNSAISDHLPVYVILKVKAPKIPQNYITARSYKYYDPYTFPPTSRLNQMIFFQISQIQTLTHNWKRSKILFIQLLIYMHQ